MDDGDDDGGVSNTVDDDGDISNHQHHLRFGSHGGLFGGIVSSISKWLHIDARMMPQDDDQHYIRVNKGDKGSSKDDKGQRQINGKEDANVVATLWLDMLIVFALVWCSVMFMCCMYRKKVWFGPWNDKKPSIPMNVHATVEYIKSEMCDDVCVSSVSVKEE